MKHLRCVTLVLAIFPAAMPGAADFVVPLTDGPGDDTEAAWSPDGTKIAFQTTRSGRAEIHVLDLETGQTRFLVGGQGQSQYPAWSPDGTQLALVHANITKTAVQGIERGHNLCVIPSHGGALRRLTEGVVREYTPCYSPDGAFIYFSSTRDLGDFAVGIHRIPARGGKPELVLGEQARDVGFMQPALAPGGDVLAYGVIRSFRGNWAIRLSKLDAPHRFLMLTDGLWPAYGPRWSPDGSMIACTGYRPGDPGWSIYIIEMKQGGFTRLDTGPGNSRSPAWSPDGTRLVFENNRSGAYKLVRMDLPRMDFAVPPDKVPDALVPLVRFSFEQRPEQQVMDLTGSGNMGKMSGDLPWGDGALTMGSGYVNIDEPKGFDFGPGAFSVTATVEIAAHSQKLRMLAIGDYPEHRHGWQLMVGLDDRLYFNSRTAAGDWSAASTAGPAPVGKKLQIVGVRRRGGGVELYVDGKRQPGTGASATFHYRQPTRVRVGALYDGSAPFQGRLYEFSVYRGLLDVGDELVVNLEEFLCR